MSKPVRKPLIVQNDLTILVESGHSEIAEIEGGLGRFAELLKSPGQGMHTYRITPLTLWNAASEGMAEDEVLQFLERYDRFGLTSSIAGHISAVMSRYGSLRLLVDGDSMFLEASEWKTMQDICDIATVRAYLRERTGPLRAGVDPYNRGDVKRELLRAGYPVIDEAGYHTGESLPIRLKDMNSESPVILRDYQQLAVERFYRGGSSAGGSGIVVLPCGAGKTLVGLALMSKLQCATLILTSNAMSVSQWKRELLDKTDADETWIGEYSGAMKQIRPITIATYQILTYRHNKDSSPVHMKLFHGRDWGLIIYDEVHLLPAPVFRLTAQIQATRRLGLTATLVREDGREEDVFSLIGPKRYEARWKSLECTGWIASALCCEVRIPFSSEERQRYVLAPKSAKFRMAGENPGKTAVVRQLIGRHSGSKTMVIGQYVDQLKKIASTIGAPLITGRTPQAERERLYDRFKSGDLNLLVVSKVANFAVDLPEASVAIQVSGSFGSRQEEAQRLGRILRPKKEGNQAIFYTLITADSCELEFARHRQLFLIEQGYEYRLQENPLQDDQRERLLP